MTTATAAPKKNQNGATKAAVEAAPPDVLAAPVDDVPAEVAAPVEAPPAPVFKKDQHSSIGIGETFTLGADDAATLAATQQNITRLQIMYAQKSYVFRKEEAALLQGIEKAEAEQKVVIGLVGNKHGLKIADDGVARYGFDIDTMMFTRVR